MSASVSVTDKKLREDWDEEQNWLFRDLPPHFEFHPVLAPCIEELIFALGITKDPDPHKTGNYP